MIRNLVNILVVGPCSPEQLFQLSSANTTQTIEILLFPYFYKSGNMEIAEIWKSRKLRMIFVCMCICVYVCMDGDGYGVDPSQPQLQPQKPTSLCHHKCLYICEHNSVNDGEENGVDSCSQPPLSYQGPTCLHHHKHLCIYEHSLENDRDGYRHWYTADPTLNHHYTIINIFVFVNTIKNQLVIDVEMDMH